MQRQTQIEQSGCWVRAEDWRAFTMRESGEDNGVSRSGHAPARAPTMAEPVSDVRPDRLLLPFTPPPSTSPGTRSTTVSSSVTAPPVMTITSPSPTGPPGSRLTRTTSSWEGRNLGRRRARTGLREVFTSLGDCNRRDWSCSSKLICHLRIAINHLSVRFLSYPLQTPFRSCILKEFEGISRRWNRGREPSTCARSDLSAFGPQFGKWSGCAGENNKWDYHVVAVGLE